MKSVIPDDLAEKASRFTRIPAGQFLDSASCSGLANPSGTPDETGDQLKPKANSNRNRVIYANNSDKLRRLIESVRTKQPSLSMERYAVFWSIIATAAAKLSLKISPFQAWQHWNYTFNPLYIRGDWTREEDATLLKLSHESNGYNWDQISSQLSSSSSRRHPIDCLVRFQRTINTSQLNSSTWSDTEDEMLIAAVALFGAGNWVKISHHVTSRAPKQCLHRYRQTLATHLTKGIWNEDEERRLFLVMLCIQPMIFVSREMNAQVKWCVVSKMMNGARSGSSCREKWVNTLSPFVTKLDDDEESDKALLAAMAVYGNAWSSVAECLNDGRTDNQCLRRYRQLMDDDANKLYSLHYRLKKLRCVGNHGRLNMSSLLTNDDFSLVRIVDDGNQVDDDVKYGENDGGELGKLEEVLRLFELEQDNDDDGDGKKKRKRKKASKAKTKEKTRKKKSSSRCDDDDGGQDEEDEDEMLQELELLEQEANTIISHSKSLIGLC